MKVKTISCYGKHTYATMECEAIRKVKGSPKCLSPRGKQRKKKTHKKNRERRGFRFAAIFKFPFSPFHAILRSIESSLRTLFIKFLMKLNQECS